MARHQHSQDGNVEVDGRPALLDGGYPLAMVYGGGGIFGIAYTAGIAAGLADSGIPVASAPSLGTSAGAWTASALALGLTYDDLDGLRAPWVPNLRPGLLAEIAREAFDEASHHLVTVSAVCLRTQRRHILDGGAYPLADLVAASSAVPGLFSPHRVDGRYYVDGGMWSVTSVDAAAEADRVIVVAPLAGAVSGALGRTAGFLLERELRRWRSRHPDREVILIRPNRDIAKLAGINPLSLFDADRARQVYSPAYEQGLRWGERLTTETTKPAA